MNFSIENLKRLKNKNGTAPTSNYTGLAALKENLPVSRENLDSRLNQMTAQILPQAAHLLKENSIELIFLFDCSNSCHGTEKATIQGFNEFIAKEKKSGYSTTVSTILFNHEDEVIHDHLDIHKIDGLLYTASGGTALYDTLCGRLKSIKQRQSALGNNAPKKTVVVIMTDGLDEHSQYHDLKDTQKMIAECRAIGWEFIFLGTKINAKSVASSLGINPNHAENYKATENGLLVNFHAVENVLKSLREDGKIKSDWAAPIQKHNLYLDTKGDFEEENGPVLKLGGK